MAVDERLADEIKREAPEGELSCAKAFVIAQKLIVPLLEVGQAANELGIKIVDCQLGCFAQRKK